MATFQLTKQYSVTLDSGKEISLDASSTVENIGEVIDRDVKIPVTEVTVLLIGAAIAAGQMTDIKLFVIHNTDQTNFITISLKDTGGHTTYLKLPAGQSFDIFNTKIDVSETGAAFGSFSDIDTISLQADTDPVIVTLISAESC